MNNPTDDDKALSQVLQEWPVSVSLPPRFPDNVWARIERAEAARESIGWAGVRQFLESVLPRPKVALAYVALLLLLGAGAGFWEAGIERNRANAALSSRYVQTVDPFQMVALIR